MELFYVYLVLLLLILFLIFNGLKNTLKYASIRIKTICICVFSAMFLRCTTLIIMLMSENVKYLFLLKPLFFINLFAVPVAALISIYILARCDKIKFLYLYSIFGILTILYAAIIYKQSINIEYVNSFGYSMHFINKYVIYIVYLLINTVFLTAAILFWGNNYSNKPGISLILIASIISIVEIIINIMGVISIPEVILSDLFWITTLNYSVNRLKK